MEENVAPKKESKFGVSFYIILVFAVIKDISDILFSLTIILSWIPPLTTILMNGIIYSYLYFIGVSIDGKKLAVSAVSSIIELIPFLGSLPMATINLVAVRMMDKVVEKIPIIPLAKK